MTCYEQARWQWEEKLITGRTSEGHPSAAARWGQGRARNKIKFTIMFLTLSACHVVQQVKNSWLLQLQCGRGQRLYEVHPGKERKFGDVKVKTDEGKMLCRDSHGPSVCGIPLVSHKVIWFLLNIKILIRVVLNSILAFNKKEQSHLCASGALSSSSF